MFRCGLFEDAMAHRGFPTLEQPLDCSAEFGLRAETVAPGADEFTGGKGQRGLLIDHVLVANHHEFLGEFPGCESGIAFSQTACFRVEPPG